MSKFDPRKTIDGWGECIKELYPAYYTYFEQYVNQREKHCFNMFIMKSEYFFAYSEWLFSILGLFEKKWKNRYGEKIERACGFSGEHLLNVWIMYQQANHQLSIGELQTVMYCDTGFNRSKKAKIMAYMKLIFGKLFPYGSTRREIIKYHTVFK